MGTPSAFFRGSAPPPPPLSSLEAGTRGAGLLGAAGVKAGQSFRAVDRRPGTSQWPTSNWTAPQEFVILGFSGRPLWPQCCPLPSSCHTLLDQAGRRPADPGPGHGGRHPAPTTYFSLGHLSAAETAYTPVLTLRALAGRLLPPRGHPHGPLCGSGRLLLAAMALGRYPAICRPLPPSAHDCGALLAPSSCLLRWGLSPGLGPHHGHLPAVLPPRGLSQPRLPRPPGRVGVGLREPGAAGARPAGGLRAAAGAASGPDPLSYARVLLVILGGCWGRGPPQGLQHSGVPSHGGLATLHDGCATAMYARPKSSHSLEEDRLSSFIYINLTPLLYPAIYTLRNRDVQGALQWVVGPRTPGAVHQADVTECWMPAYFLRPGEA
nr:olfactory receptor 10AC1-like [Kogia breviceps]